MKTLFYSPISWPHLSSRCSVFPHSNAQFDAKLGIGVYSEALELFRIAEAVGFDWLGVGEEHMNAYGVVPNPCVFAAALAPITSRARLCILGNPLPLLNPMRVAEEYAMIDMLSGGRLVAGFPRGVPQNYVAYGADLHQSKERLAEAIEFVVAAWTRKGPFDWQGAHYRFANVTLWPQPVALPEIVLSSRSPESVTLAVHHRAVMAELYVKNRQVLEHFVANRETYCRAAAQEGWQAGPDRFLVSVPCVIAPTCRQAAERARAASVYANEYISGSFETRKQDLRDSYYAKVGHLLTLEAETIDDRIGYGGIVCGDPAAVVDQIQALKERTGIGIVGLQMQWANLSLGEVRESLELFGSCVRAHI